MVHGSVTFRVLLHQGPSFDYVHNEMHAFSWSATDGNHVGDFFVVQLLLLWWQWQQPFCASFCVLPVECPWLDVETRSVAQIHSDAGGVPVLCANVLVVGQCSGAEWMVVSIVVDQ